jgi:hypothetical protein
MIPFSGTPGPHQIAEAIVVETFTVGGPGGRTMSGKNRAGLYPGTLKRLPPAVQITNCGDSSNSFGSALMVVGGKRIT